MGIINEHKRAARKASRENGSSYQSELNAIAKEKGFQKWGDYLQALQTSAAETDPQISRDTWRMFSPEILNLIQKNQSDARQAAKQNGTSYREELRLLAEEYGHRSYGRLLQYMLAGPYGKEPTMLRDLPGTRIALEDYAGRLSSKIITGNPKLGQGVIGWRETNFLTGLILAEVVVAKEEERTPSIRALREWLTFDLEEATEQDQDDQRIAVIEGKLYDGDRHAQLIRKLTDLIKEAQPYGRAYAEMWRLSTMAKAERFDLLMEIIPALSNYIDTKNGEVEHKAAA